MKPRVYCANDRAAMETAFGQPPNGLPLPQLTDNWTLDVSFDQVKSIVIDTINVVLKGWQARHSAGIDVIIGQRATPPKYGTYLSASCVDDDHANTTLLFFLHEFDEERLRASVIHEMLHVLRFEPQKRERRMSSNSFGNSQDEKDKLLDTCIEEGLAEALVCQVHGYRGVSMGEMPFEDPADIVKIFFWRDQPSDPSYLAANDSTGLKEFLCDHRHYAVGYHIICTIIDAGKYTLSELIRENNWRIWGFFLEERKEVYGILQAESKRRKSIND